MLETPQITVIGTGLLGGSLGLALRAAGYQGRIIGVGRRMGTVLRSVELGCVDEGHTLDDLESAVARSGLVVLATPLSTFPDLLGRLGPLQHGSLIVTDVGSTKSWVLAQAGKRLDDPRLFVGSHPMAGTEQQGPDAARPDLFAGKPCIVTPQPETDPIALNLVEELWHALGMTLHRMDPEAHDAQVAAISHLPHALAVLLVESAAAAEALDLASTGFRDTTRVACGDPQVWLDVFTTNRAALRQRLAGLGAALQRFDDLLAPGREADLLALLQRAQDTRRRWGAAFGRAPVGE